jgi:serine/threonine protein kinase
MREDRNRSFPTKDDIRYIQEMISGVRYLHAQHIIHRDLKPENILLFNNSIKISDFGLAKKLYCAEQQQVQEQEDSSMMMKSIASKPSSMYLGTPLYAPPEQYLYEEEKKEDGPALSKEVDIYSLCVIFFELSLSFKTEMERIICIQSFRDNRIAGVHPLLQRAMGPPGQRPSLNELESVLGS